MLTARRLLLLFILMLLPAGPTAAQMPPWPTDSHPAAAAPPHAPPWTPLCMAEFTKLREDVQNKGLAAKAAGQRKVSREEMCSHITAYSVAVSKWIKWTESSVQNCGIPVQIVQQLQQVQSNTEETKKKICAAVPSPWLDVPSPALRLDVPGPALPSRRLPSPTLHIAVWLPGRGQVVLFAADSAPSAALLPKSGG